MKSVLGRWQGKMPNSPLVKRLAKGGMWSLVGDFGIRGLAFIGAILVARWLGVEEYGAFALVQSALGMMQVFAQFGLGQTTTRYVAACRETEAQRITNILSSTLLFAFVTGGLAAGALFAFAPTIAQLWLSSPSLEPWLKWVAPVLVFNSLSSVLMGAILGFEAFNRYARLGWLTALIRFILLITGVWIAGIAGAVIGLVTAELVGLILVTMTARVVLKERGHALSLALDFGEINEMWRFSLPLLLGSLLHSPIMFVCYAIIAKEPAGIKQIGIYDAAQKWMTMVMIVPFGASAAFAPILANLFGSGDTALLRGTTLKLGLVQFSITAIPALLVAFLSGYIIHIYGAGYAGAQPVIVFAMILAPIFVLRHLYWQALTGGGKPWLATAMSALWAVVAVLATWHWQHDGAIGLAKSMLLAYTASFVGCVLLVEKNWRPSQHA